MASGRTAGTARATVSEEELAAVLAALAALRSAGAAAARRTPVDAGLDAWRAGRLQAIAHRPPRE